MREKKKNLDKKLLAYSMAAGATLACSAEGAFIFTDLNDVVLQDVFSIPFSFDVPDAPPVVFGMLVFNYNSNNFSFPGTVPPYPIKQHVASDIVEMQVFPPNTSYPYKQFAGIRLGSPVVATASLGANVFSLKAAALNLGDNIVGPSFADDALLGARIDNRTDFTFNPTLGFKTDTTYIGNYGNFFNVTNKYIGLHVNSRGTSFYGWIRVSTNSDLSLVTVHDWAWENTGVAILAGEIPEPGNLGLLAAGAAGLMAWRRRRGKNVEEEKGNAKMRESVKA